MRSIYQVMLLIFFLCLSTVLYAQSKKETNFTASQPVLITSAGQSADILMAKILAKKAGLRFVFNKTATAADLDTVKSVLIVCGGSTKGLGAAKIDKEQEYKRVEKLINAAKKQGIKIIAVHLGGKSRRGALSDYFNKLVAENADYLIVVKAGNEDGFFTDIAKKRNIGLDLPEKIVEVQALLEKTYGPSKVGSE